MTCESTRVLTIKEFRQAARIGRDHLYREIRAGQIAAFVSGKRWLIPEAELPRYIARQLEASPVAPSTRG